MKQNTIQQDNAFTGLEAAIVLIAFVVVAAIFSYVMLGAGFFATQKAQEVTYAGITQATSNLIVDGMIYGKLDNNGVVDELEIPLKVPIAGQAQDLTALIVLYSDAENSRPVMFLNNTATPPNNNFTISDNCQALALPGAVCSITLELDSLDSKLMPGDWFSLEIKPAVGAATLLRRVLDDGYTGGYIT